MPELLFIHGLEGSPQGTKGQRLRREFGDILAPEFSSDVSERIIKLEEFITEPVDIVGSSLGGLTAILFAMRRPELVRSMLLLAPAVGFYNTSLLSEEQWQAVQGSYIPQGIPCHIVIAEHDELIPEESIRKLVGRSAQPEKVAVSVLDDYHNLNQSLDRIMAILHQLLANG